MPTKDEEIAALKALLKSTQERANKAEKKLKVAEKKADRAERKADLAEKKADMAAKKADETEKNLKLSRELSYWLLIYLDECREEVIQHYPDFPEIQGYLWKKVMINFALDLQNVTSYRTLARLVIKGNEKVGKTIPEKDLPEAVAKTASKMQTSTNTRTRSANPIVSVNTATGKRMAQQQPEIPAERSVGRIANTWVPVAEGEACKSSPGRQAVEKFKGAPLSLADVPTACPDCGSTDYEISEARTQQLRDIQFEFNDAIEHIVLEQRNGRCFKCGHVHHFLPADKSIPVAPGRTISQNTAISIGTLYAMGIPLNRLKEIFINSPDGQLGHSTLFDNVHDWAMQTGKVLADQIANHLKTQSTVIMDETTFTVLQSQGRGNCKLAEDARPCQKDYLAVQTSGFAEEHPCVFFKYLGGRKIEDITKALDGFNNDALVTDAYAAYDSYVLAKGDVVHQCCLVHLRRMILDSVNLPKLNTALFDGEGTPEEKVEKAIERTMKGFKNNEPAFYFCSIISALQKIYALEKWLKRRSDEAKEDWIERIRKYRSEISTPLMDDIDTIMKHLAKAYVEEGDNLRFRAKNPNSLFGAAISYYLNHRDNFRVFLTNPFVEPDSSSAERCIRAVTVLRKGCDFKQSAEYMDSMCVYFTLVETAKMHGFNQDMTKEWLEDFGRAYYLHRANATLTHEVNNNGRKLENKLMGFNPDSAEGFDVEPWLPWNYLARRNQID